MLNIFPELLILGFFAPLILRVVLGVSFLWFGYNKLIKNRKEIVSSLQTNPVGPSFIKKYLSSMASFIVLIFGVVEIFIGISLVVGYLTQIAVLVGIVTVLKTLYYKRSNKLFAPHDTLVYILTIAISLSLLISGAGAFAFDLPL